MKRTFAKLLSLFVVLTLVIAMLPAVFAVDGIVSVTAENTTLKVNKSTTVSVTDANGTAVPNVTLSSDHDDIVSVIDSSTIKALKVGSATITATVTAEDKTVQTLGSVQITVQSGVSAITPDTSSIEIDADNAKTAFLSVTLTGAASGDVLAVQSSDTTVVTVPASVDASTGSCSVTLTAVKTGTAAVTLSCGQATPAQVTVTVKATKDHTVTFEKQKLTVEKAKTATNTATKATAGDKLTYASSSTAVATVDASTGAVTGVAAGTATITANTRDRHTVLPRLRSASTRLPSPMRNAASALPPLPTSMAMAMNTVMMGMATVAVARPISPMACPRKMESMTL